MQLPIAGTLSHGEHGAANSYGLLLDAAKKKLTPKRLAPLTPPYVQQHHGNIIATFSF